MTSNHIHLLVVGDEDRDVIPNSIKLIAGRTGQEYNQRKNRKGAFWEDQLQEPSIPYGAHFGVKKGDIGPKNTYFSNVNL